MDDSLAYPRRTRKTRERYGGEKRGPSILPGQGHTTEEDAVPVDVPGCDRRHPSLATIPDYADLTGSIVNPFTQSISPSPAVDKS